MLTTPVGFSKIGRSGVSADICRFGRFTEVSLSTWGYGGSVDYLVSSVDKDIMLHGLSLFGSENNAYTVDFQLKDASSSSAVASKKGTFLSKRLQYKDSYYYGYEVLFDSAAELKKNSKYQIEAQISGKPSEKGNGGF